MKKIFLFVTLAVAALAISCQQKEVVPDAITVTSQATEEVTVEGGVVTINFTSNVAWEANSSQQWVTISPVKGDAGDKLTIKASVLKNETTDGRSAEVTITGGTASAKVTINQGQKDAVVVPTTEFAVDAEGGVVEIPVSANVDIQVVIPEAVDWIRQTEPDTKGMVDSKVYLMVDPSFDLEAREAVVKINAVDVKIQQAAFEAYFEFDEEHSTIQYGGRLTVPQEGGTFTIGVATNLEWRTHYDEEWPPEDTSWLEFKQEEEAIVITVKPNEGFLARDNWIYVNAGEELYGDVFGGYFQVYQEPVPAPLTPQLVWTEGFPEGIVAGYNRLAFTQSGALLVSDGTSVHALNPADGAYWKAITFTGVTPTSIDVDDAGNIIVAENVQADMNWDTSELVSGTTIKIYTTKDVNEALKEIELPNGVYGTVGGFRARGDIATKGAITGVVGGAAYWIGFDMAEYKAVPNYYGTENSGAGAGDVFWTPETAAAVSYGPDLHDGVLYRAYDGKESVFFRKDCYTPKWAADYAGIEYEPWTLITNAGAGGNENQNNMDIIDYKGKKILALTQGYHFTWAGFNADIYVLDVTDTANPTVLATIPTATWISAEWPNGQNSADVLLREGEGFLELYAIHSGLSTIAKFVFDVE